MPVRNSVDLRWRNELNNGLYQLKVDVGMLNVSSVSPQSSKQKIVGRHKP